MAAALDMSMVERARREIEGDREAMRQHLVIAAGSTIGHGLDAATAAVLIILDHYFPEHGLRLQGWREAG